MILMVFSPILVNVTTLWTFFRDVSRGVLLLVNRYGILNSYHKLIKNKDLKVILSELSPNTMSNTIDKYITNMFSIVNK